MSIKSRIEKLERLHKPDKPVNVIIYATREDGVLHDCATGKPIPERPKANGIDIVIVEYDDNWRGPSPSTVYMIPDNGRS